MNNTVRAFVRDIDVSRTHPGYLELTIGNATDDWFIFLVGLECSDKYHIGDAVDVGVCLA